MVNLQLAEKFSRILIARRAKREISQENLAKLIGSTKRSVQTWESGSGLPDMESLLGLMTALGEGFTNDVLSIAGFGGAKQSSESLDAARMVTTLLGELTTITRALEDGRIDHIELPSVIEALSQIATSAVACRNSIKK